MKRSCNVRTTHLAMLVPVLLATGCREEPRSNGDLDPLVAETIGDSQKVVHRTTWPEDATKQPQKALVVAGPLLHYYVHDDGGWQAAGRLHAASATTDGRGMLDPVWAAFARRGNGGVVCAVDQIGNFNVQIFQCTDEGVVNGAPEMTAEESDELKQRFVAYLTAKFPSGAARHRDMANAMWNLLVRENPP